MPNWPTWWSCEGTHDDGWERGAYVRGAAARTGAGLRADMVGPGLAEGAGGRGTGLGAGEDGAQTRAYGGGGRRVGTAGARHRRRSGPGRHRTPLGRAASGTVRGAVGPFPGHGGRTGRACRGAARPRDAPASGGGRGGVGSRAASGFG